MKTIRFYLALWAAKAAGLALRLLRRNASYTPGVIALKLCPDYLARIQKPQTMVGVTGTNGKTTVSNLLSDLLTDRGVKVLSNRFGSNILGGIATVLTQGVSLGGKCGYPMAVLEMDERSSRLVLPYVQPDYMVCTNLFRDSFKRNAHSEYIQTILKKGIPAKTKLVLNADDLIAYGLKGEHACLTFGVAPLAGETEIRDNIIRDVVTCPVCDHILTWDFCRYNHVGRAHCEHCGMASPTPDVETLGVDPAAGTMTVAFGSETHTLPLPGGSITDIYNTTAAAALLTALGWTPAEVADSLSRCGIVKSRYNETAVGRRKVVMYLAKGQNPVACSRVFDTVRRAPGRKAVLIINEDHGDAAVSSENIAWLYETDFEFLRDDSIVQIVAGSVRCQDYKVRLLLAGVAPEKLATCPDDAAAADLLDYEAADTVYILYDLYTYKQAVQAKKRLLARMEGGDRA